MHFSKGYSALALVLIVLVAGCGQQQESSSSTTEAPPASTPAPSPEPTAAGVPPWVAALRQKEMALRQSIDQGQLGNLHDQSVELNALLKPVSEQAGTLAADQQQQLNEHLSAATRLADELHSAGDAGDLTKAKAKFMEFQTHLRAIEGVFGVAAP